ncbi:MAG: hypothetical protein ACR2K2_04850 [Mycobacteriales bacterium]
MNLFDVSALLVFLQDGPDADVAEDRLAAGSAVSAATGPACPVLS